MEKSSKCSKLLPYHIIAAAASGDVEAINEVLKHCNVMFAEVPVDGDWRADVDFYDDIETAYKKRLRRAFQN